MTNPKTASNVLVSEGIRFNNSIIFGMKADGRPEIPKTRSRRPNGMTIDAAEMNPTRTGWEMKLTTPPRLKTPKNKIIQPVMVKLPARLQFWQQIDSQYPLQARIDI